MYKPISVKPLPEYRLWLEYSDGISGEVDLSHLAGKGVFSYWDDYANFEKVYIGESREIAWSDKIDLCPDALYMKIVGKSAEELFEDVNMESAYA
ncbi:MAG: DUF2442 domain-containing protein [Chloroflexi bacterium]|nr:MAG: DUF2442 domain-containing protein [Chloroflexota bacterium]